MEKVFYSRLGSLISVLRSCSKLYTGNLASFSCVVAGQWGAQDIFDLIIKYTFNNLAYFPRGSWKENSSAFIKWPHVHDTKMVLSSGGLWPMPWTIARCQYSANWFSRKSAGKPTWNREPSISKQQQKTKSPNKNHYTLLSWHFWKKCFIFENLN